MAENKEQKMDLSISEEVAQGVYSNLAILSHSENEFFVDFASLSPGIPKAIVRSRVIMTPVNAKRLLRALQDNVSKYEEQFGVISETSNNQMPPFMSGGGLAYTDYVQLFL